MCVVAAVVFVPFVPAVDVEGLVAFLTGNEFPFHVLPRPTEAQARARIADGRFWSEDSQGSWIEVDGERIGIVVLDELLDVAGGGSPLFDLRLAERHRGKGLGQQVLRAFTALVFERYPEVTRLEGQTRDDNVAMRRTFVRAGFVKEAHYREAWPVDGGGMRASIAYAILRRDWMTGTTTPVPWDDPEP